MRARLAALGLCLLVAYTDAQAGAWPRGKGKGFVSVAYDYTTTQDGAQGMMIDSGILAPETFGYTAFYGEFGLSERATLGLDIGEEDAPDTRQVIVFARHSLRPPDRRHQVAIELGIGSRDYPADSDDAAHIRDLQDGGSETVIRPGLSWGYGFASRWGNGWAALDLRQEYRLQTDETVQKADLTLGLARGDRSLIYLQAQYSAYPDAPQNLRLVPSYVRKFAHGFALETALLYDVLGGDRVGLRAGLWWNF